MPRVERWCRYAVGEQYDAEDPSERELAEESGWKLVRGDVFRAPRHLGLLCCFVGTGLQLAVLALGVIMITILVRRNAAADHVIN